MRRIKKIDFYKKYTNNDTTPTVFGAFMSVLTLIIMFCLCGSVLSKYLNTSVNHKVGLIQFPVGDHDNTMALNIDIVFDHLPCSCMA